MQGSMLSGGEGLCRRRVDRQRMFIAVIPAVFAINLLANHGFNKAHRSSTKS